MELKKNFLNQFGKPTGNFGTLVGLLMSLKNKDRALWTFENLKLKPDDIVLEVGFGPGSTIKKVADNLTTGFIAGIDHSEVMLEQATKRNKKHIERNTAKLECGTVWDLKYSDNYFDTIFGSNVHFFWDNPVNEFKKLVSLLKSNGRLVMVFQPRWTKNEEEVIQVAENTKKQFEDSGLKNIEYDFKKMKPVNCIYISGQK
jgi:ubiquinone/menaquinone biosynthesis C-methylase UbiE